MELELEDLQCNGLKIYQSKSGYRFTMDAVALANFVKVKNNGNLLDLCSGSGVIGILANAKNRINHVYMVELQERLAKMCAKSVEYNNLKNISIINQKLQDVHKVLKDVNFDTIVCNPPYYKVGVKPRDASDEIITARNETKVTLQEIIKECSLILKDGGKLYMCHKLSRLVDIFNLLRSYKLEPKEIKIITESKNDQTILIKAIKKGEVGLKLV